MGQSDDVLANRLLIDAQRGGEAAHEQRLAAEMRRDIRASTSPHLHGSGGASSSVDDRKRNRWNAGRRLDHQPPRNGYLLSGRESEWPGPRRLVQLPEKTLLLGFESHVDRSKRI